MPWTQLRQWFRRSFSRPRRPSAARRRWPPYLERLEDRITPSFSLGTATLLEGPAAGTDSDIVVGSGAWTAT